MTPFMGWEGRVRERSKESLSGTLVIAVCSTEIFSRSCNGTNWTLSLQTSKWSPTHPGIEIMSVGTREDSFAEVGALSFFSTECGATKGAVVPSYLSSMSR